MKAQTLWTKAAAGLGTVALALTLGGCSHQDALAGQDSGQIRTEQSAQQDAATSGNVIAEAPAPSNTQGTSGGSATPAIISGPAKVDSTGRVYTSSATGGSGNASSTGLNTNVNIIPEKSSSTVTQSPAAPLVTESSTTTTTTQTADLTPATEPMTSSTTTDQTDTTMSTTDTTTTTTTRHRRMRKD